jgi:hypothetical protein
MEWSEIWGRFAMTCLVVACPAFLVVCGTDEDDNRWAFLLSRIFLAIAALGLAVSAIGAIWTTTEF